MKSTQKQRSSAEKQKDKEERTTTGKKLVQARLPFKILSAATGTDSTDTDSVIKKRKLQFEDADTNNLDAKVSRKSISKSDVKENVSVLTIKTTTTIEISPSPEDIVSIENSNDEESSSEQKNLKDSRNKMTVPSELESHKLSDNSDHDCNGTPELSKKKGSKLKIKFPFNDKKKRNRRNDSMTSKEDDEEITPNPLKKAKKDVIVHAIRKENNSTPSSVIELISDDDEPIDDSDVSTIDDVKCLEEKNNQECEDVHNNEEKVEECVILKQPQENGASQAENEKDTSSKAVGNGKVNDCILVEDDDTNCSNNESISTETSQSTKEDTLCRNFQIKSSSVRINKEEFKKFMKKIKKSQISGTSKQAETSDQKNEEPKPELYNSCVCVYSDNEDNASEKDSSNSAEDENVNSKKEKEIENASSISKTKTSPKLTPGRLKKLKEMEQRREERLRTKEEKERKLQEEKDQKKKEKEERELQRKKQKEEREEQKRKEKEEKEEQRRKEKEEKEKKRLAEIDAKNEERRQKEEMKEEERRRKEEERKKKEQEKEEAENKKKREAEAFTKFFVLQKQQQQQKENDGDQNSKDSHDESQKCYNFMPFQVKDRMKLAPLFRRRLNDETKAQLDKVVVEDSMPMQSLYLSILKSGKYTPGHDTKTYPKDDDLSDVLVIEDELEGAGQAIDETIKPQKYKAKFLYFHENQRPPYYGTWRKKSKLVKPRKPFATDKTHFDYEVDSDEEWEEEEPGESLNGSDDDKDKESEDEYEVDNEFFVPHGHLSEEEINDEDEQDNSPETQKAKLKILQQEFVQEMKKKTEKIKPKLVGIVWQDENGNKPDQCPDVIWASLNKRAMMFTTPPIVVEPEKPQKQQDTETGSGASPNEQRQQKQKEKVKLTEDLVKDLIRLFHGNTHNKEFLIKEFQAHIAKKRELNHDSSEPTVEYSKVTIRNKIDKMAEWTIYQKSEKDKKKLLWIISSEYLKRYNLEDLSLVNQWSYILQPKKRFSHKIDDESASKQTSTSSETTKAEKNKDMKKSERKCFPIKKFTKVLSKEEKLNQIKAASSGVIQSQNVKNVEKDEKLTDVASSKPEEKSKPSPSVAKKRVALLLSVPRGQQIPQERKDKLISNFLKKKQHENGENETKKSPSPKDKVVPMEIDNNDVVVIN